MLEEFSAGSGVFGKYQIDFFENPDGTQSHVF
jgi:hypothetical protein